MVEPLLHVPTSGYWPHLYSVCAGYEPPMYMPLPLAAVSEMHVATAMASRIVFMLTESWQERWLRSDSGDVKGGTVGTSVVDLLVIKTTALPFC